MPRAVDLAPDAHLELWHSAPAFFASGRTRAWEAVLGPRDVAHLEHELERIAGGEACEWVLGRRPAAG